jgi:hypothetical protein
MSTIANFKRPPGTLAERFWSLAKSAGPSGDEAAASDPKTVVQHVLRILDALTAGEVGAGLSQSTLSFLTLLRQQEAAGDLSYASPEQARGETLDERSLVFSVGVLMFEELTGRHPFGAVNNPRRFARIQKCELGSGVQYFPQVPSQLRNVLMRAMGPFPEERFPSMRDLRDALERFLDDRPERDPLPKLSRMKGLPPTPAEIMFGNHEDSPTRVLRRPASPPMGTPVGAPKALSSAQAAKTVEVAALPEPGAKHRVLMERMGWIGLGAGGALAISLLLVPSMKSSSSPPPTAQPLPTAVAAQPVAAPVAAAPHGRTPTVTPMPQPAKGIEPPAVPPVAAPPTATFDLDFAGKDALANAHKCFGELTHSVSFGAGLFFSKDEAIARRVFLSPDEPLTPDERKCVKAALALVSAGAAPDKSVVPEFRFRVKPGDGSKDEYKFTLPK